MATALCGRWWVELFAGGNGFPIFLPSWHLPVCSYQIRCTRPAFLYSLLSTQLPPNRTYMYIYHSCRNHMWTQACNVSVCYQHYTLRTQHLCIVLLVGADICSMGCWCRSVCWYVLTADCSGVNEYQIRLYLLSALLRFLDHVLFVWVIWHSYKFFSPTC